MASTSSAQSSNDHSFELVDSTFDVHSLDEYTTSFPTTDASSFYVASSSPERAKSALFLEQGDCGDHGHDVAHMYKRLCTLEQEGNIDEIGLKLLCDVDGCACGMTRTDVQCNRLECTRCDATIPYNERMRKEVLLQLLRKLRTLQPHKIYFHVWDQVYGDSFDGQDASRDVGKYLTMHTLRNVESLVVINENPMFLTSEHRDEAREWGYKNFVLTGRRLRHLHLDGLHWSQLFGNVQDFRVYSRLTKLHLRVGERWYKEDVVALYEMLQAASETLESLFLDLEYNALPCSGPLWRDKDDPSSEIVFPRLVHLHIGYDRFKRGRLGKQLYHFVCPQLQELSLKCDSDCVIFKSLLTPNVQRIRITYAMLTRERIMAAMTHFTHNLRTMYIACPSSSPMDADATTLALARTVFLPIDELIVLGGTRFPTEALIMLVLKSVRYDMRIVRVQRIVYCDQTYDHAHDSYTQWQREEIHNLQRIVPEAVYLNSAHEIDALFSPRYCHDVLQHVSPQLDDLRHSM